MIGDRSLPDPTSLNKSGNSLINAGGKHTIKENL